MQNQIASEYYAPVKNRTMFVMQNNNYKRILSACGTGTNVRVHNNPRFNQLSKTK